MNFVYLQKSQKLILIRPISSKNSKKGKEVRMENYIEVKVAECPQSVPGGLRQSALTSRAHLSAASSTPSAPWSDRAPAPFHSADAGCSGWLRSAFFRSDRGLSCLHAACVNLQEYRSGIFRSAAPAPAG